MPRPLFLTTCRKGHEKNYKGRCVQCRSEYMVAYQRDWYLANKEECNATSRARAASGADKESHRKYYLANKAVLNVKNAAWSRENRQPREVEREKLNAWRKANPEKCKLQKYRRRGAIVGSFTKDEWQAIVDRQKGLCLDCGEKKPLTVDHIIPVSKGGVNYAWNLAGRCRPCNSRKGPRVTLKPGEMIPLHTVTVEPFGDRLSIGFGY